MELDSKVQAKEEDVTKEKKNSRIHRRWNTIFKVRNEYVWVWVAIDSTDKTTILDIRISLERTMLVAERFLKDLVKRYGKRPVSTDGNTLYPQACNFLELKHHLHSHHMKKVS